MSRFQALHWNKFGDQSYYEIVQKFYNASPWKSTTFQSNQTINLYSSIILTLTIGNEICYANISMCPLSISNCLVTYDMN